MCREVPGKGASVSEAVGLRPGRAFPAVCEGLGGPVGRDLGGAAASHPALDLGRQTGLGDQGLAGSLHASIPSSSEPDTWKRRRACRREWFEVQMSSIVQDLYLDEPLEFIE